MWPLLHHVRRSLFAYVIVITYASVAGAQPAPDGLTVSSNQDAELCRPKGRCFIPESDDPIFIGDVIETFAAGRFDFLLPGTARILLLSSGKIRIDRGTVQMVEIELLGGMVTVETFTEKPLDVTLADLRCRVSSGPVAISYQMLDKRNGSASVANGNGSATCFSTEGPTHVVERNTVVDFYEGRAEARHSVAEGFWTSFLPPREEPKRWPP